MDLNPRMSPAGQAGEDDRRTDAGPPDAGSSVVHFG